MSLEDVVRELHNNNFSMQQELFGIQQDNLPFVTKTRAKMQSLSDQLTLISYLVRRLEESPLQLYLFEATKASHDEVICFDEEDDNMDFLPWKPVLKIEEDPKLIPNEIQLMELEVERPWLVSSFGTSYMF